MQDWVLYIALVMALAIGFFLGSRQRKKNSSTISNLDTNYVEGLNFLLNEQHDAAIDRFIAALEVNSETLETHLALGNLLRKRGEVDRAIRIHQNLLARPGLTEEQAHQAQYELATDFVKSGLLDRAEGLLVELVSQEGIYRTKGLIRLVDVYQDEKEWEKGLEVLQKLAGSRLSRAYEDWAPIRAHFCCELAEKAIQEKREKDAKFWIKQALSFDRNSLRAGLLQARVDIASGSYEKAISSLQKLISQYDSYIAEILPLLQEAYTRLKRPGDYKRSLYLLNQQYHDVALLIALADIISQEDGDLSAAKFVADQVIKYPSGSGLHKLLEYYIAYTDGSTKEHLQSLKNVMEKVISNSRQSQCSNCGFKGREVHWLCPSCKTWGSIKPKRPIADEVVV